MAGQIGGRPNKCQPTRRRAVGILPVAIPALAALDPSKVGTGAWLGVAYIRLLLPLGGQAKLLPDALLAASRFRRPADRCRPQ
jgi:hypothetical protein